jgi:hypothetical protein
MSLGERCASPEKLAWTARRETIKESIEVCVRQPEIFLDALFGGAKSICGGEKQIAYSRIRMIKQNQPKLNWEPRAQS